MALKHIHRFLTGVGRVVTSQVHRGGETEVLYVEIGQHSVKSVILLCGPHCLGATGEGSNKRAPETDTT